MSATLPEADEIVRRLAGARVRVDCGDHSVEGVLRREVRRPKNGVGPARFAVFGRSSNWREYAERFAADAETYRKALRSAARPELHYIMFDLADRIEVLPEAA